MKKLNLTNFGTAVAIAAIVMIGGLMAKAMDKPGGNNVLRPDLMKAQVMKTVETPSTMNPMDDKIKNG